MSRGRPARKDKPPQAELKQQHFQKQNILAKEHPLEKNRPNKDKTGESIS